MLFFELNFYHFYLGLTFYILILSEMDITERKSQYVLLFSNSLKDIYKT